MGELRDNHYFVRGGFRDRFVVGAVMFAVAAVLAGPVAAGEGEPMVVAHRGASGDAPENTLAAFRLAWEQGADAIEGDFYLTKDGQIVCTHDRETGRLNPEKVKLDVAGSTLAELQALDVGGWKGPEWQGLRMPTLQQVLGTVPAGKRVFVEVKCGAEILPQLKREIDLCPLDPGQITIISFQKEVIAGAKKLLPEIKALWLMAFKVDKESGETRPTRKSLLETLAQVGADGVDCGDHPSLTTELMRAMRAEGYEVHCWTVDDPKRASALGAMGVESITTNRPEQVRAALGGGGR